MIDANASVADTHRPQNEGQHVQRVYKSAMQISSAVTFHNSPEAFMDESDYRVTAENREKLFHSWARYWNASAQVLIEKSPRHITMTRFLQAMFSRDKSRFLFILRHPFGCKYAWGYAGYEQAISMS